MNIKNAGQFDEFKSGWRIIFVSVIGVACGITAIPIYTIGAFVGPFEEAYGWSRGATQSATVFAFLSLIFAGPVAGALTDKFGPRVVAIFSVIGISLGVASVAALANSIIGLYIAYALIGLLGAGTSPVVWTRAVSSWFERKRGLAFGLTLMGTGIFAAFGPAYVTGAIEDYGWRGGYLALALLPVVIVLPLVLIWFREKAKPAKENKLFHESVAETEQSGLSLSAAARTLRFWLIGVSFFLFSICISGFIASYIPMLTDVGFTRVEAASMAGAIGLSVIIGRMVMGVLLDYIRASYLTVAIMLLPTIGCLLWGFNSESAELALLAAISIGLAGGAEFDLIAYMASRYFGLKNYGSVYGVLFSFVIAGAAVGPLLFGFGFDALGAYGPILLYSSVIVMVGIAAQFFLGDYPKRFAS